MREIEIYMGKMCVYIAMEDYVRQWFVHEMGGKEPVSLPRGTMERKFLDLFIDTLPDGATPSLRKEGTVAVEIPVSKTRSEKDYHYLSEKDAKAFVKIVKDRFDIALWRAMHIFGKISKRQDYLFEAWMAHNGIDDSATNTATIAKRYQRLRNRYKSLERAARQYELKNEIKKGLISEG